ncbi:adenylate/guanylate cyclase domain-containing protein [Flammeovirga yaeyamensis]|uniref:Adenylate/guanylate cyclase domain-containing protein n=1 Tax=Flammeovirga yaeyamensis TaxID=367791 RepID=A0AAX1NC62_9BACT|nr:adenylate/guanylate cyclase domain-containing protein [Flammeovirga yaeyamensis]MBB3700087.1 adenylate cyclase [Flammeovirga yaeyamensis]NMF37478.1 adenylate/guanylate cyclase domain-containing protein [Flammeovirga yaeyamensis]QWG04536.1 adenylate/guanylate cyclase domain-containing protein [Flammeovirga yaeyamensis]
MKIINTHKLLFKGRQVYHHLLYGILLWVVALVHEFVLMSYPSFNAINLSLVFRSILIILTINSAALFTRRYLLKLYDFQLTKFYQLLFSFTIEILFTIFLLKLLSVFMTMYHLVLNEYILIVYLFPLKIIEYSFLELDEMIGPLHLKKMLFDKYSSSTSEERVFLFADLNNSTQIANQLGEERYSNFLKDVFEKFSVIYDYYGDIFQYVGDEVVITWKVNDKHKNAYLDGANACLDTIKKSAPYFLNKYGIAPQFKMALHSGKVMTTTIGQLKKELCFHGEAINVTSKIQQYCDLFHSEIVVTKQLLDTAKQELENFEYHGFRRVKGGGKELELYTPIKM